MRSAPHCRTTLSAVHGYYPVADDADVWSLARARFARSPAAYTRCTSTPSPRPHAERNARTGVECISACALVHQDDDASASRRGVAALYRRRRRRRRQRRRDTLSLFHRAHIIIYTPTGDGTHAHVHVHIQTHENSVNGRRQFGVLLALCKSNV